MSVEFKVGDRVRCVASIPELYGKTGTIHSVSSVNPNRFNITWDYSGKTGSGLAPRELELVGQTPTLHATAISGAGRIAIERARQIDDEGYGPEEDIRYNTENQLVQAAWAYLISPDNRPDQRPPTVWPWGSGFWKPSPDDRVRELTKAGALIAAEIDRLLAVEADTPTYPTRDVKHLKVGMWAKILPSGDPHPLNVSDGLEGVVYEGPAGDLLVGGKRLRRHDGTRGDCYSFLAWPSRPNNDELEEKS